MCLMRSQEFINGAGNYAVAVADDDWYNQRVNEVANNPWRYPGWKIVEDKLYFRKPKAVVSQVVRDFLTSGNWWFRGNRAGKLFERVTIRLTQVISVSTKRTVYCDPVLLAVVI